VQAASGELDPTFGIGDVVITPILNSFPASGLVIQAACGRGERLITSAGEHRKNEGGRSSTSTLRIMLRDLSRTG
jgi:hypothetical protein